MGGKRRILEIQLTEQQKIALRCFAQITKKLGAQRDDTGDYTENQLDHFTSCFCVGHRILGKEEKNKEFARVTEWREGEIKLFSAVVSKERLARHCEESSVRDCEAKNCPVWEEYTARMSKDN